jgi:hypothetical protein
MSKSIIIRVDDALAKLIKKRAGENMLSEEELVEDIVRRSMISYKEKESTQKVKCDDALVDIFSRQRKGRKRKK